MKSLFRIHNETGMCFIPARDLARSILTAATANIRSHLLGALLFVALSVHFFVWS